MEYVPTVNSILPRLEEEAEEKRGTANAKSYNI
jgi:hypothetical protein